MSGIELAEGQIAAPIAIADSEVTAAPVPVSAFRRRTQAIKQTWEKVRPHVPIIDLSVRLLIVIAATVNYAVIMSQNERWYTFSEKKLMLCSVLVLLIGFHHSSMFSYPITQKLSLQLYMTLLLVYTSMTFESFENYMLVKPPNKDFLFLVLYYIYLSVLLPNVAAIVFIFFMIMGAIAAAMVLQVCASFGYDVRPWRDMRITRVENRADSFKRNYKQLLNGYFYKHSPNLDRDFVSLDEDPRIEENSVITMNQAFSCARYKREVERRIERKSNALQSKRNDSSESYDDEGVCSICYVPFKHGAYLIELPVCGHTFHYGCLNHWVDKNPSCPICRFDLYKFYNDQTRARVMQQALDDSA